MIDSGLASLVSGDLVRRRPPADMLAPGSLLTERGAVLPLDHLRLLSLTNGLDAYGGHVRLFGIGPGGLRDMRWWNHPEGWRRTWCGRTDGWWFIGETAWGDQYAYAMPEDPLLFDGAVYRLDADRMEPEPVAESFAEFLRWEIGRSAVLPRSDATVAARERFGDLDPDSQLAYVPTLLEGGDDDPANLVVLPAGTAMALRGRAYGDVLGQAARN